MMVTKCFQFYKQTNYLTTNETFKFLLIYNILWHGI